MTQTAQESAARLELLTATALSIGQNVAAEIEAANEAAKRAKVRVADAREGENALAAKAQGFGSPLFVGLGKMADAFGDSYGNTESKASRDAALTAARTFASAVTKKADDSGGTSGGYADVIALGRAGSNLILRAQRRLEYWQDALENAKSLPPGADRAAEIAHAERFTQTRRDCLNPDGSIPTDDKGKPRKVVHVGRPEKRVGVNGKVIHIPARGAGDRKSALAELARIFDKHGANALEDSVLDAWLDTGGKWKPEKVASVSTMARDALDLIDELVALGGMGTTEAPMLRLSLAALTKLATTGAFTTAEVAPDVAPAETAPEAPTEEAPTEEAPPTEGAVLGAPAPSGRARRKKSGALA